MPINAATGQPIVKPKASTRLKPINVDEAKNGLVRRMPASERQRKVDALESIMRETRGKIRMLTEVAEGLDPEKNRDQRNLVIEERNKLRKRVNRWQFKKGEIELSMAVVVR